MHVLKAFERATGRKRERKREKKIVRERDFSISFGVYKKKKNRVNCFLFAQSISGK